MSMLFILAFTFISNRGRGIYKYELFVGCVLDHFAHITQKNTKLNHSIRIPFIISPDIMTVSVRIINICVDYFFCVSTGLQITEVFHDNLGDLYIHFST